MHLELVGPHGAAQLLFERLPVGLQAVCAQRKTRADQQRHRQIRQHGLRPRVHERFGGRHDVDGQGSPARPADGFVEQRHGVRRRTAPGVAADRNALAHDELKLQVAHGGDGIQQVLHIAAVHLDDAAVAVPSGFAEQDGGPVRRQGRAGHRERPAVRRKTDGPSAEVVDRGVHPAQCRRTIDAAMAGEDQGPEVRVQRAPALQVGQQFGAGPRRQRRHALQHVAGLDQDSFGLDAHDARRDAGLLALRIVRMQPGPPHADEDGKHQGQRHWQIAPGRCADRHSRNRQIALPHRLSVAVAGSAWIGHYGGPGVKKGRPPAAQRARAAIRRSAPHAPAGVPAGRCARPGRAART
ncbi:hypothetical protein D9M68_639720 [compost metagenome]